MYIDYTFQSPIGTQKTLGSGEELEEEEYSFNPL